MNQIQIECLLKRMDKHERLLAEYARELDWLLLLFRKIRKLFRLKY